MTLASGDSAAAPYVLGHSAQELQRLTLQARLLAPITRRLLLAAGVASGMRVLDVGSGMGDVAFLAAELVGPAGHVVGADLHLPRSLTPAREQRPSQLRT
jgi:ubiquinone/menaquinone biosynthesis C-methylase UbiE